MLVFNRTMQHYLNYKKSKKNIKTIHIFAMILIHLCKIVPLFLVNMEDDYCEFDAKQNSLFDGAGNEQKFISLSTGSPGPDLLEPLTEMMKVAVQHRMVRYFYVHTLSGTTKLNRDNMH